jgi:hypothetical protein
MTGTTFRTANHCRTLKRYEFVRTLKLLLIVLQQRNTAKLPSREYDIYPVQMISELILPMNSVFTW